MLREVARTKGDFDLGAFTREQADELGRAWVGDDYTVESNGKVLLIQDGLRAYRPPSFKSRLGGTQANLEWRTPDARSFRAGGNGHITIIDP